MLVVLVIVVYQESITTKQVNQSVKDVLLVFIKMKQVKLTVLDVKRVNINQMLVKHLVLIAYQERMRRLMVRLSVMIAMMMNINRNQMLQAALKFKKVIIDQVQLQKLFVQLVKQEVVVVHCALNARKGRIKSCQATPRALNVQLAGAMQVVGLLGVMRYHPDPIVGMA
jgi:hypothetical protein